MTSINNRVVSTDMALDQSYSQIERNVWKKIIQFAARGADNTTDVAMLLALASTCKAFTPTARAELFLNAGAYSSKIRQGSLKAIKELVSRGMGLLDARDAALAAAQHPDKTMRLHAINLFKALVNQNHSLPQAIRAATAGMRDEHLYTAEAASKLFNLLVKKGEGHQEAIQSAREGLERKNKIEQGLGNDDDSRRGYALALFTTLVKQEVGYQEATEAIRNLMYTPIPRNLRIFSSMFYNQMTLLKALIGKGQAYAEAERKAIVLSMQRGEEEKSIELLICLVRKGQARETAQNIHATIGPKFKSEKLEKALNRSLMKRA